MNEEVLARSSKAVLYECVYKKTEKHVIVETDIKSG